VGAKGDASTIGGQMDLRALARIHFTTLDHGAQVSAIRRMQATGQSDTTIAAASGWSVEAIRAVLAEAKA
jgi:hypothetical protein